MDTPTRLPLAIVLVFVCAALSSSTLSASAHSGRGPLTDSAEVPFSGLFTENGTWTMQAGVAPFNRSRSAVAYDASVDDVVLFGGLEGSAFEADTWAYDPGTGTWTNVTGIGAPSPRVDASVVYDSSAARIILFGGAWWTWDPSGGIYWGGVGADTWAFNGATHVWTELRPAESPPARSAASMVYDSRADRVLLFGGYNGSAFFNDTWSFDYASDTWTNLTGSVGPARRLGAAMTYDAAVDRTILFGGEDSNTNLGDTWWFDLGSSAWIQKFPSASPAPRFSSGFVYDPVAGWDVLFGGYPLNAETWTYQPASNEWIHVFPSTSPPACFGPSLVYVTSASKPLLVDMRNLYPTQTWWYVPPLSAPSAPMAVHAAQGFGGVQLSWSPPISNGGSAIAGYRIYRGTASQVENYLTSVGNVTSYTDTGAPSSGTVYYLVSATNMIGEGPFSSEVSVSMGALPSSPGDLVSAALIAAVGLVVVVCLVVIAIVLLARRRGPRTGPP